MVVGMTIGLAACGGDEMTVDEYRTALNSACEAAFDEVKALPARAQEEALEIEEVEEIGREVDGRFLAAVEELQPPPELEEAHGVYLDAFREEPPDTDDLAVLLADAEPYVDIYADLGATRCESLQAEAVAGLREAQAGV